MESLNSCLSDSYNNTRYTYIDLVAMMNDVLNDAYDIKGAVLKHEVPSIELTQVMPKMR